MTKISAYLVSGILPVLLMGILAAISVPKSLTGDESLTVTICRESFGTMVRNVSRESHIPGYHALLWSWIRLFGSSLPSLRIFAFLPVGFLIWMGSRHFRTHGFLVLGASPFLLHLAVELRMYGLMAAFGVLIVTQLQRSLKDYSLKNLVLLAAVCAGGIWVHYFVWCGVAAATAVLFLNKRRKASLVLLLVCAAVMIPWVSNLSGQIQRFSPAGESASVDLFQLATPAQRLMGVPFSIAGAFLRFAAGNSVFEFNLFSVRNASAWTAAGIILLLLSLFSVWRGRKSAGKGVIVLLLFVFLPLSLIRPTARHFSIAYFSYASLVIAGLGKGDLAGKLLRAAIPVLSLLLCIPFITRTTMPQRCTFDRDYREAAVLAGSEAMREGIPLVVFLDTHSLMGIQYHLEDEGFAEAEVVHPHIERFSSGWYFYVDPSDLLGYLMQDTDSLVRTWGDDFLLLANDPVKARGPLYGDDNKIVGRGSDVVSDLDLFVCLERYYDLEEIPLPRSEGPLTLFHATVRDI